MTRVLPGDPAPMFIAASSVNPKFRFETSAGRYVVLSFFHSSAQPFAAKLLEIIQGRRDQFDLANAVFFGVSSDAEDRQKLKQQSPGIIYFFDDDRAVSRAYGVIADGVSPQPVSPQPVSPQPASSQPASSQLAEPVTLILDQALRVVAVISAADGPDAHAAKIFRLLAALPHLESINIPAPVLVIPYVFEPDFCKLLIEYYNQHGGEDSGFMRDVGGKTVGMIDHSHKRRSDCSIEDPEIIKSAQMRLSRRVLPIIKQAFSFDATRIERHIVACYDARDGGHFGAHRDNTTLGTAHRRFAVTINLNAEEFEGGELRFAEFSRKGYRAPTGGAVVFSCSLMHQAMPVTRGRRYAFLPFLYDDAAAQIRQQNLSHLAGPQDVATAMRPVTVLS